MTVRKILLAACLPGIFYAPVLPAAQHTSGEPQPPAVFASIWDRPKLYENKDNPSVQSFSLVGRYHGQYWSAVSEGNREDGWENRRIYLGFNTKLFQQFTLEAQFKINDDFAPVYKGLYEAFIQWENKEKNIAVRVGRLNYLFSGLERSTSSKRIKTVERSLLVNQIMPGEVIGIHARGQHGGLAYQAGVFSGSIEDEFTSFKGGFGAFLGVGTAVPLFYDRGTLHLDYLYNNGNEDNKALKPYEHIVSLWYTGQKGPLAIGIDLTTASGLGDQSDVFGLTLLPTYDLVRDLMMNGDSLQLALRYHYASSSDDQGLKFNKRYEQPVTSGRGNSYSAGYLGLNYYIYRQKLKLMAGVEYFAMADVAADEADDPTGPTGSVDGWDFMTAVRLYF